MKEKFKGGKENRAQHARAELKYCGKVLNVQLKNCRRRRVFWVLKDAYEVALV